MNNELEIERKFLVTEIPFNLNDYSSFEIVQGYLSLNNPELRIRKKNNKYYITSKNDNVLVRSEKEKEITENEFNILKDFVISNYITKTRYLINLDKLVAELDIYHNQLEGLKVVEVEFNSVEEAKKFEKPYWFGEEITNNKNYKNSYLAENGL